MKRKIIPITLFLIVIIALYFGYRANRYYLVRYPRVQATFATRNDLIDDIEVTGIVSSDDIRDLYLNSTSKVETLAVKEGDRVRTGQTLAVLNSDAKQLELAQCRNNIHRLERELILKKIEEYAPAGLRITEEELKTENLRKNILLDEISELTIRAPINGRISVLSLKSGETVTPGIKFAQIINDALLSIEADVPAEKAARIKPGDNAEIRVPATTEPYPATVIQIMPPVKEPENRFSNPRIKLRIGPGVYLIPGTVARVRVRIGRSKLAVTVPVEAIHEETVDPKGDRDYFSVRPSTGQIRKYVYILKDCSETLGLNKEREKQWLIRDNIYQAHKVYVETGISSADRIEIVTGLKPSEQIVIYSDRPIRDYSRVIMINRDESYKQPIRMENGD